MLLFPKKVKFKKTRKGDTNNKKTDYPNLLVGDYGIFALESGYINSKQLEASRQTISRHLERKGKIRIMIFPDLGITKKPNQVRIGKGAGKTKYWVFRTQPGKIIFEVSGVPFKKAEKALNSGAQKLPIKVKVVLKQ